MEQVNFLRGDVIFKEGEYQKWMYSICKGAVDIFCEYGTPHEKKLTTLTEGQFFGEIGMIALLPRTATAVAAGEAVVLERIDMDDLEGYLKKYPENLQPIMMSVSGRLRILTDDLSEVNKMVHEALNKKQSGEVTVAWLAEAGRRILGKLKAKKASAAEFTVLRKRQQALSGQISPLVRFSQGNVIFCAGERADCMYHITEGCVGIYSDYRTENEKLLTRLDADSVFGEMGILEDMPRSATAVCLTDCTLLLIKRERFLQFFQDQPVKVMKILQQLCMQLRSLTGTYLDVCKTLEELTAAEETDSPEDQAWQQLEFIHQSQLCVSLYDNCISSEWFYI